MIATEPGSWKWGQLSGPLSRNGIFLDNDPGTDWFNRLGHWNKMDRSKRDLCIDVKGPGGREVLHRLIGTADIVVNNYSPRGVRSLGITPTELREMNPEIVTLDLSQLETAIAVAGDQFGEASLRPAGAAPPPRRGARSPDAAPAGVYRCRGEDAWLALTVTNDESWTALADLLGDHAHPGEQPELFPGLPFRFNNTPAAIAPPPKLGQHNEAILTELGYTTEEIATLYEANTIATAPPS